MREIYHHRANANANLNGKLVERGGNIIVRKTLSMCVWVYKVCFTARTKRRKRILLEQIERGVGWGCPGGHETLTRMPYSWDCLSGSALF